MMTMLYSNRCRSVLILVQTISHSNSVPERFFLKNLANDNKSMKNYPACKEVMKLLRSFFFGGGGGGGNLVQLNTRHEKSCVKGLPTLPRKMPLP